MARLQRCRFSDAQDVRVVPHGRVEIVELDDRVVGRETCEPGWRWSVDVKPIAGTPSCQFHHFVVTLSGRMRVQMNDGLELEVGPGEVAEVPPGHDAWVVGDEPWVGLDFESMRSYARGAPEVKRVLSSVLLTDIVESTARAVAHGPARWRDLVSRHNEIAERLINEFDGQLIKTTGDGVLARFDSTERAVRTGTALSDAIHELNIETRGAVHTGEAELVPGDVRGLVVHVAARMISIARPGEVIVSAMVRDLLDGTKLEFEDYGTHQLKGLSGTWQLYRVVARRSSTVLPAAAH